MEAAEMLRISWSLKLKILEVMKMDGKEKARISTEPFFSKLYKLKQKEYKT